MNALHRYPGPMLAISMAFAYAGLSAALKAFLSSGRSPVLAMLFRYASSSLVVLIYAAYSKATRPNTKELKQLIVRGTIAALASASFAYSLVSLDVGVATVLNYMSPVIAGPAGMLIGEKWMVCLTWDFFFPFVSFHESDPVLATRHAGLAPRPPRCRPDLAL